MKKKPTKQTNNQKGSKNNDRSVIKQLKSSRLKEKDI